MKALYPIVLNTLKPKKLNRIADFSAFSGILAATVAIFIYWHQLPSEIPIVHGIYDISYAEKGILIGFLIATSLFQFILAVLSRFPKHLRMLWSVTDENHKSQLQIAHQAHNFLRIWLSLALNGIVILDLKVALNHIEEVHAWHFSQISTVAFLLIWGAHIYLAYKHR